MQSLYLILELVILKVKINDHGFNRIISTGTDCQCIGK